MGRSTAEPIVRFEIYVEEWQASLSKLLGGQDVVVGRNAEFDRNFIVKTADAESLYNTLTEPICYALLTRFGKGRLTSDGNVLELTSPGVAGSVEEIEYGIELLLTISGGDPFGLKTLGGLP